MAKTLLRNNSQSPISLPPPYTGILAPGEAFVINDPPSVVIASLRIVPELINYLIVTQVPDSQSADPVGKEQAAGQIAEALAELSQPLDLNGQRIVNLADPIDQQDAATKQYVDLHAGGGSGTVQQVNSGTGLTGGPITVTGTLSVDFGDGAGKVVEGTNARLVSTAPGTAGGVVYDTGAAYAKTAAGAVGEVLKVGAGGLPEWGADTTAPSGPAGGDLQGSTYPNPIIKAGAIDDAKVSATAAISTSKLSGLVTDIAGNGLAAFLNSGTKIARTYFVSVDGVDAPTADGSISAPFASVQYAHDQALTDFPGTEYVVIEVGPGSFLGDVNISRVNTMIQGTGHRAEMYSTRLVGSVTINPASASDKFNQLVGLAGCFVSSNSNAAVKVTGSGLYSLILNDCYLYTNSFTVTAAALACDATNPTRPRIIANDCIMATEVAGPNVVQLDRGDARFNNTQIRHNSGVSLGAAGSGVAVLNDATLWLNGCLVETRTTGAGIVATGASAGIKLLVTNTGVTTAYAGAEDSTHGITVGNTAGVAAFLYQVSFNVADVSASVYAVNASAPSVVVYADLSFQPGTNSAIAPAVVLTPMVEKHGTVNLPSLTASLPLKLDAGKNVTASQLSLTTDVTGTLPVGRGGTGIATTPPAGSVVYGNGTTQAYTAVGTSGQALISTGTGAPAFGALDLAAAGNVSGQLPSANQAAQTLGGDLSGTTAAAIVTHLRTNSVAAGTLSAGDAGKALVWSGSEWAASTITPGGGGGGGGGGLTYYFNYTTAGDAPLPAIGSKELSLVYDTGAQVNTGAVTAPESPAVATLAEFVTDLGQPGTTTIAPGNWDIAAYMVGSGPNNTHFRARVFKWDGTTLTELSTSPSDWVEITTTPSPTLFTASVYIAQATLTASERIVIRLEIQRTTAAARTVTGYFNGNTPSHTHTTLGAPGGTGIVKVVDGIVQSPASLIFNADIDLNALIDVAKLDGGGSGNAGKVLHGGAGAPTWSAVALGSDVSGQLPVPNGGTGLASGTQGGVLYFPTTSSMASTGSLTANALMLGGGASGPTTLGSLGTSTQFLKGNAAGAPTWDSISLSTDITGTLPIAHGGTNGTATPTAGAVAYGTGTAYDFSLAGSAGQVLTSGGIGAPQWVTTLGYAAGGTGNASAPTLHGVAYGDGTKLVYTPAGTPGQVLTVGVGGDPEWGTNSADPTGPASNDLSGNYPGPTVAKIRGAAIGTAAGALVTGKVLQVTGLSTVDYDAVQLGNANAVAGNLPVGHGGTGIATTPAAGELLYGNGTEYALLANTAGDSGKFLKSNGAAAPYWANLFMSDLSGTLPISKGGTNGTATPTAGGVAYGTGSAYAFTAMGGIGQVLKVNASNLPEWADNTAIPAGNAGGDLSGTYPDPTVAKINGASVTTAGTTGQVLQVTGINTLGYGAINLASAASVTGVLAESNQADQSMGGDVSGTTGNATVAKIQGNAVQSGALGLSDAGKALVWSGAAWNASTISGAGGSGGGGGLTYFLNYTNAGAAPVPAVGAKELSLNFDDVTPSTNTGAITVPQSSYVTLAQFVTPVGEPGATTIPPGIWEVGVYAMADVSDSAFVRAVLSKWDGTTLTTIATASNVQVTATGLPELTTVDFFVASTVLASNERLVLTLEGTRTVAGSRSLTLYFEGDTVSHIHTTLGAPGGTGVVKVVDGVVQAPASLIVNADVALNAAIAVTKLDGTTGGGTVNKVLHGGATPSWSAVDIVADTTGTLTVARGGTGITTTPAAGTIPYGNGTNYSLLSAGTSGQYLKSNGASAPSWTQLNVTDLTGTLTTANGGTGLSSVASGSLLFGPASGTALSTLAISAVNGAVLTSTGTAPTWATGARITDSSVLIAKPLSLGFSSETVTAGTTISAADIPQPFIKISAASPITMTSSPVLRTTGVANGTLVNLVNTGTNSITIRDDGYLSSNSKIQLGGVNERVLVQYSSVGLIFDSASGFWIERAVGGSGTVQAVSGSGLIGSTGGANPTISINGLASGTQGGIPWFNGTTTMASSGLLTQYGLVIGGGASAAPSTIATGTSGQLLISGGSGAAPSFGTLDLSNTALTGNFLPISRGGTGVTSVTTNGVVYGASSTNYASTAAGTTGTVLKGNTGSAPSFGAVNLSTDVTSVLPIANGGTGDGSTVAINTVFAGPASGGAGAPSYRALVAADIPTGIPASSITSIPYDIAGSAAGTPNPSSNIFYFVVVRACTIAATGHRAGCNTAPSGNTTFDVLVSVSGGAPGSIGSFTINSGATSATFSLTQTSLAAGDVVIVQTPSALNAIQDPYFTFVAALG